jgi:hypothetical protein
MFLLLLLLLLLLVVVVVLLLAEALSAVSWWQRLALQLHVQPTTCRPGGEAHSGKPPGRCLLVINRHGCSILTSLWM